MSLENGKRMYEFVEKIFPYTRSITGEGVRQTISDLKEYIEKDTYAVLNVYEVPSGSQAFDWSVPKEWEIKEAYIEDEAGNHIIDIKNNNLHVVGYSVSVDEWVDLDELKSHIFTQADQPDVIPYVTSYYKERYGFCMSENQKNDLKPGKYHMYIDSRLCDGCLNYAEVVIPGQTDEEVFFSTYICHPSMANNECSGPALSAELVRYVSSLKNRRYTYRFVYIPETIGSLVYMAVDDHLSHMKNKIVAGYNLSCVGDDRVYSMVETKYADTLADKSLKNILKYHTGDGFINYSFLARGSDEREYGAPGADLPVVCFCRSKFGEYPEYHTSADDLSAVSPEGFAGAYDAMTKLIDALEANYYYEMTVIGEPQLGKRGLYPDISKKGSYDGVMAMKHFMAYADGKNDIFDISNITGVPVDNMLEFVDKLFEAGLVMRC